MKNLLPRQFGQYCNSIPRFLFIALAFAFLQLGQLVFAPKASATHLLGGSITYVYLGNNGPSNAPFRFRVTMTGYVDSTCIPGLICSNFPNGNYGNNPRLGVYNASTGQILQIVAVPDQPGQTNVVTIKLPVTPGCSPDDTIRFIKIKNKGIFLYFYKSNGIIWAAAWRHR